MAHTAVFHILDGSTKSHTETMSLVIKGSSAQLKCKHQSTHRHTAKPNKYTYFLPWWKKERFQKRMKHGLENLLYQTPLQIKKKKKSNICFPFSLIQLPSYMICLLGTFLNSIQSTFLVHQWAFQDRTLITTDIHGVLYLHAVHLTQVGP